MNNQHTIQHIKRNRHFEKVNFFILLLVLISQNIFSQIISNNGAFISVSSGAVIMADTIQNDASGTLANNGTLNIYTVNNAGVTQGNGVYNVNQNFTNTGTFLCGLSTVNYKGSGAQNINALNYYNLTVSLNGPRTITLANAGVIGVSNIFSPSAGATSYLTAGSTVDYNGSLAQNVTAFDYNNLTVSGGNTKTVSGNSTIINTLRLAANTILALSANIITLKSTSTGTARLDAVPATSAITYGSGKFIVERYIPGRRKYRLITSSVTTSTANTLTTGQEGLSIWGNWQNQGNSISNIGTYITGGTAGDGFDQNTTNASLYTYDAVNRRYVGYTTANSKNTKYTPLKAGIAYYMFVYGDRTNTAYTNTPNFTTLSAAGTLLTGDQTYNNASAIPLSNVTGQYTMLGNPFASPIDWALVTKTNLADTYWGWDPNLSSTGGYVTINTAGAVTLISPFTGATGLNQYIQPGQGFFVRTTATSPVLVIKEQDKVGNFNANAFTPVHVETEPNNIPLIAVNLLYGTADTKVFADGALAAFDDTFSNTAGKEDAAKMQNAEESVAIANGGTLLSIDARPLPKDNDTLFLKIEKLSKPQYTLQIFSRQMDGVKAYIEDAYLKTTRLLLMGDTNRIVFNVTADVLSADADRFRIVFNKSNLLPATPEKAPAIKVFPNPVKNQQIHIKLTDLSAGDYTWRLINGEGIIAIGGTITHDGNLANILIPINKKLNSGIYYLQLQNKKEKYSQKIIIE